MSEKYKYLSLAFLFAFALTAHTFEHEFAEKNYETSIEIECEFCPVDDISKYSYKSNTLNSYKIVSAVSCEQQSLSTKKSKNYHQRAPPKK